jgi:hypothetical protein
MVLVFFRGEKPRKAGTAKGTALYVFHAASFPSPFSPFLFAEFGYFPRLSLTFRELAFGCCHLIRSGPFDRFPLF